MSCRWAPRSRWSTRRDIRFSLWGRGRPTRISIVWTRRLSWMLFWSEGQKFSRTQNILLITISNLTFQFFSFLVCDSCFYRESKNRFIPIIEVHSSLFALIFFIVLCFMCSSQSHYSKSLALITSRSLFESS